MSDPPFQSAPLSSKQLQRVLLASILLPAFLFLVLGALVLTQAYRVLHEDAAIVASDRVLASCARAELACSGGETHLRPRLVELQALTPGQLDQQGHLATMLSLGVQPAARMLQGLQAIFASAQSRRVEQTMALQQALSGLLLGCVFAGLVPIVILSWWQRRYLGSVQASYTFILAGLRTAAKRLQSAQEQERRRIARELHDDLGQIFASYKMDLNWLSRQQLAEPLAVRVEEMLALNASAVTSVRRIVNELRPAILDDLGLLEALDWLLQDFGSRSGVAVRSRLPREVALSGELQSTLFRIVQEGLTNVGRHAGATQVSLQLKLTSTQVWLRLADNGRGVSGCASTGRLGVRERAEILGGWAGYRNRKGSSGAVLLAVLPREESACVA
jgi:signal transduction histidine kinase